MPTISYFYGIIIVITYVTRNTILRMFMLSRRTLMHHS